MGLKKWLGGDKPVTQLELNSLIFLLTLAFLIVSTTNGYLDRKQIDRSSKIDREIREDQHKFNMRIQKEINDLKIKDYCRHELGFKK